MKYLIMGFLALINVSNAETTKIKSKDQALKHFAEAIIIANGAQSLELSEIKKVSCVKNISCKYNLTFKIPRHPKTNAEIYEITMSDNSSDEGWLLGIRWIRNHWPAI